MEAHLHTDEVIELLDAEYMDMEDMDDEPMCEESEDSLGVEMMRGKGKAANAGKTLYIFSAAVH